VSSQLILKISLQIKEMAATEARPNWAISFISEFRFMPTACRASASVSSSGHTPNPRTNGLQKARFFPVYRFSGVFAYGKPHLRQTMHAMARKRKSAYICPATPFSKSPHLDQTHD